MEVPIKFKFFSQEIIVVLTSIFLIIAVRILMKYISGSKMEHHSVDVSDETCTKYGWLKYSIWRLINGIMAMFFAFAAVVQINDPDSIVWILLYAVPAFICIILAAYPLIQGKLQFRMICLVYSVICTFGIIYSLYTGSEEILKNKSNVFAAEEAREAGGLAIVVSWLLMVTLTDSKSIHILSLSQWMRIVAIAFIPFLSAMLWLYTVDMSQVPKHCSAILRGLKDISKT